MWNQEIQEDAQKAWLEFLTEQPRAAQLLPPESTILGMLEDTLSRFLKDVRRTTFKADKRSVAHLVYLNCHIFKSDCLWVNGCICP